MTSAHSQAAHPDGPAVDPAAIGDGIDRMRAAAPLVQCLTNVVVTNWTANVLLASGAAPAMIDNSHEAGVFSAVAGGVLVNLGTPQDDTVAGMRAAVAGAHDAGTPWVLDPIGAGGLPWRTEQAHELLAICPPAIVRGNASEIVGLAGGVGGRGTDSTASPEDALDAARALASEHNCVVAVSGAVDHITDGTRLVRVANGHEWLTRVTGAGCSLGALMAAFAAAEDRFLAAVAATALLTVAAEDAATGAAGPGSFAVALLDRLHSITNADVAGRVRLS